MYRSGRGCRSSRKEPMVAELFLIIAAVFSIPAALGLFLIGSIVNMFNRSE